MALSKLNLQRQLKEATEALAKQMEVLQMRNVDPAQFRKDPTFRKLKAKVKKCEARLEAVKKLESITANLAGGASN